MKLTTFLKILALSLIPIISLSCSKQDEENLNDFHQNQNFNEKEAIQIATEFREAISTRGTVQQPPKITIITNSYTRNNTSDPLAYVLNYPNENGFVIVSAKKVKNPILAFSDTGHFDISNDIVVDNFIKLLPDYLNNLDESEEIQLPTDSCFCHETVPYVEGFLHQLQPWNKYVTIENPDCLAGCVPIATAMAMSYSKPEFTYAGTKYYFNSILNTIEQHQKAESLLNSPKRIAPGYLPPQPEYSYDEAVDLMAKLIYRIGLDTHVNYSPGGSGTKSDNALALMDSLGYITSKQLIQYNIDDIVLHIKDNKFIYLSGVHETSGHAWIADGCYYCVDPYDGSIVDPYIHCDWGYGGSGNGYFTGKIFSTPHWSYRVTRYFWIKRDYYSIHRKDS